MIYLLTMALVIGVCYVAGSAAYGHFKGDGKELKDTKVKLQAAKQGLQLIASGISGNPQLEAQLALEYIETYEIKELN